MFTQKTIFISLMAVFLCIGIVTVFIVKLPGDSTSAKSAALLVNIPKELQKISTSNLSLPSVESLDFTSVSSIVSPSNTPTTPIPATPIPPTSVPTTTPSLTPSPTPATPVKVETCTPTTGWASQLISVTRGRQLNNALVPLYRGHTSYGFGEADSIYYSLGLGGSITYGFNSRVLNGEGDDITIYEVTQGRSTYPIESATVEVSGNGITWFPFPKKATSRDSGLGTSSFDLSELNLQAIIYVRITDIPNLSNPHLDSDGFDINAVSVASQTCNVLPTRPNTPTASITPTRTPTPSVSPTPSLSVTPSVTPNPQAISVSIDFTTQISTGSPLVFGGSNFPDHRHEDAWNKIADAGVTTIRRDLFPEFETPQGITLEMYKNNVNDVQNVAKWNKIYIDTTNAVLNEAKTRGMTTMAIMAYSPPWLNSCNCRYGVPTDFDVYRDIVKKVYINHRNLIDYIEIWNEPTWPVFLDVTGSSLTREQAYVQIFKTAASAIREADAEINDGKRAVIGGLTASSPEEFTMLQAMINDAEVVSNLDFISYHDYHQNVAYPSWTGYKNILATAGLSHIPVYMTEWNYLYDDLRATPFNGGAESIPFTGRKFTEYLRMGLKIAQYHSLIEVNTSRANNGAGTYGFYRWDSNTSSATLLEQSKTWRLLSKSMGLGAGESKIYSATTSATLPAIGFENSNGKKGMVLVNESNTVKTVRVTATGLVDVTEAKVYRASQNDDGAVLLETIPLDTSGATPFWNVSIPPLSVAGIIVN